MRIYIIIATLALATLHFKSDAAALSDIVYPNMHIERVTSVYDGDTFRADLYNIPDIVGKNMAMRVFGVDTPELYGSCDKERALAIVARDFTASFLMQPGLIELHNVKRGKYFRIVATPYINGVSLTEELIKAGLAVPYFGGTKVKNWCK